jgi:hypothetical protein
VSNHSEDVSTSARIFYQFLAVRNNFTAYQEKLLPLRNDRESSSARFPFPNSGWIKTQHLRGLHQWNQSIGIALDYFQGWSQSSSFM